jgi:hypothetical protein
VSFAESRAALGAAKFCFAVAADRACDPAASACCSAGSRTKKLGLREFRLAIGACVVVVFVLVFNLMQLQGEGVSLYLVWDAAMVGLQHQPPPLYPQCRPALLGATGARAPAPV